MHRASSPAKPHAGEPPKAQRRRFSRDYKERILQELDGLSDPKERRELLRRESLYTSHIAEWRKRLRRRTERKDNTVPMTAEQDELERLRRENEQLVDRLRKAERAMEVQKNVFALLRSLVPESSEPTS